MSSADLSGQGKTPGCYASAMAADCEALSADGRACGIGAIGRCRICGQAYSLSHRAITVGNYLPYTDYCLACQTRASESEQQAKREAAAHALAAANEDLESVRRLTKLLLTCGSARYEPRRELVRLRTNHANPFRAFFGPAHVPVYADLEPAVAIGELPWEFPPVPRGDSNQILRRQSGVTRSGVIVLMNSGAPGEEFVRSGSFGVRASNSEIASCLKATLGRVGVPSEP
jgi:hypothetical protein